MIDRIEMRLRGRMLEKFAAHAVEKGICFLRIERTAPQEMQLCTCERDSKRLLSMAQEYGMELSVIGVSGKAHWRSRFYERGTVLLGLLLGTVLVILFCSRIWQIEAVSSDGSADAELLSLIEQTARQWGIYPGMRRQQIDREELARFIQLQHPELTYVSVRRSGVKLTIETALEAHAPEVYELSDSRDLVAARDAVVVHVEVLTGQASVKAGDTVRKGQILIRGKERIDTDATHDVRALGTVLGRVWFTGECRLPTRQTMTQRTGRCNTASELRLYDWVLELDGAVQYPCEQLEVEYLPVGGLYLPLMIVRTTHWEAQQKDVGLDIEKLRTQGAAYALAQAREQLPEAAQEMDYWIEYVQEDSVLTVRVTIEAQMNIAGASLQDPGI